MTTFPMTVEVQDYLATRQMAVTVWESIQDDDGEFDTTNLEDKR